jgi:pyruvate,water dikinase
MIDAYISEEPNSNYAYFRFLGGVTEMRRRSRRARLLADILLQNDFRVDVRGDLVVARIKKLPRKRMEEKVRLLGSLVAFTRQLDIRMISDEEIVRVREEFNGLKKNVEDDQNPRL